MSQNAVLAFWDRVEKDSALQGKLRDLDLQNDAHLPQLLKLAADAGYPITTEEWKSVGKQRAEALQANTGAWVKPSLPTKNSPLWQAGTRKKQDRAATPVVCVSINETSRLSQRSLQQP
jgi:hypothetical protein